MFVEDAESEDDGEGASSSVEMDSESDETESVDQEDQNVNSSIIRHTNEDISEFDEVKAENTMSESEFCSNNEEIRMINGGKQELLTIIKNYRKITFTRSNIIL